MLETARIHLIQSSTLQTENAELKTLLKRHEISGGMLGAVLSRPYYSPYDTFIIDIGAADGIEAGNIVFSEMALVGIVEVAYKKTARVKLFSSPGMEIEVSVGGRRIPALAHGLGGGSFQMKLPYDISIKEGDAVFYPSLESPLIGVVKVVKSKQANPLQTILFQTPKNIWETRFVMVVPQFLFSSEE
jgi:cell shape-determining protein MreC